MSKFTGVALLLSGVGISIYSLSTGTVSRSTGTISSSPPQTAAHSTSNGSEQGEPQNANQPRPGQARKIAANDALLHNRTPAATPGSYSAKRPLLLQADAPQRSPAPRITKQAAQTNQAQQSKQPWWRFALPSWDAAPKKVTLAQLKSKTGGTARSKTSPLSSQSRQNAQFDQNATDLDADLLDHTAPNSSRQAASTQRGTERSTQRDGERDTERKIAQARNPGGIINPTLIATVGEATTTSEETGFDQLRPADEQARFLLAKNLQKELYRVGCYRGSIDGKWGRASRRAMRNFTDQVKATLPVSEPDYILLTLVQGHASQACSLPCSEVNGGSDRQPCSDEGLIFAAEPSGQKSQLVAQSRSDLAPSLLAPPLPVRPETVSRQSFTAIGKAKTTATIRELADLDPDAIALPARRSGQLAGQYGAPSTSARRIRLLTSKTPRKRQADRFQRASRKVPLPGRMTIGAGARARAARLEQYSEGSGPTSPRLAPAPRLRDDQFGSGFQLGDRGALIRSPTSLRSASTQTEVARIRAEARAAVKQARALAESKTNARSLVRTEPARRQRLARKRRPKISKPKYYVGAKKQRARKKGPSAARIRAWKLKAWKRTYYQDQVNNGR